MEFEKKQRTAPHRLKMVKAGWYDYAELGYLTDLSRKAVTRMVLRCCLKKKMYSGKDSLGRPRKNLVLVYWPGYKDYEGLSDEG